MTAEIDDGHLDDLRARLQRTRRVPGVPGDPWQRGTDADFLAELVDHWATRYDWRAAEANIRAWPWQRTSGGINLIHQRGPDDAPVVVLLHGWPDSFLRFARVLPLLADLHVVVPCLPGYPYSASAGADQPTMADQLSAAVAELGYERCVVSGGDIGAQVAEAWARAHPGQLAALHLTDIPYRHVFALPEPDLSGAERDFLDRMRHWQAAEGSYAAEQATKPNTLSAALGDSPAGLAAWIVEKLRAWSDPGDDVYRAFTRDDLLTWVSVYWFTATIGTSFAPYALRPDALSDKVEVPTFVSAFAHEPLLGPRELAERLFDVRAWTDHAAGGHFAAWEQPEAFAADVRAAVAAG